MNDERLISVSQLTGLIKIILEENFDDLLIIGEVSNFKAYPSGHWYFSLKDEDAVISCTMWKSVNYYAKVTPTDGMKVIITGRLTVYPPRGNYQVEVRSIKPAGEGELFVAFEKLKHKLSAEGLFEPEHKKPIPTMPMHIGIVTSPQAAALQDMISVAKRRFPLAELIISPCQVQGAEAPRSIIAAIKELNTLLDRKPVCEVIIIGRGGGSIEDLWAFNDEGVARAIFASAIPVVSGVGHQTDTTIADFVADLRAPTPTAAMELITPNGDDLLQEFAAFRENWFQQIYNQQLDNYDAVIKSMRSIQSSAQRLLNYGSQRLDHAMYKFQEKSRNYMQTRQNLLALLHNKIINASPEGILKKGFVLVEQAGKFAKRSVDLSRTEPFTITFFDGKVRARTSEEER